MPTTHRSFEQPSFEQPRFEQRFEHYAARERPASPDLPEPPEEPGDWIGLRFALFLLCVGFFVAALWVINTPTFEKCSAIASRGERSACYEALRNDLLRLPVR
jgi:hypothetical protein